MEIHIGKRVADVSLVSKDGNKVRLTIDGILYEVDVVMAENGACSILHNGVSYNAELIRGESGKNYTVNTHFLSYGVDIVDTQVKYLRMRRNSEERQDNKIISPMPGKVVKVAVQKGDRLEPGDIVVVIEAMKMQPGPSDFGYNNRQRGLKWEKNIYIKRLKNWIRQLHWEAVWHA